MTQITITMTPWQLTLCVAGGTFLGSFAAGFVQRFREIRRAGRAGGLT